MFRVIIFLTIVLGLALLFAWVADNPGMVFLQSDWLSERLGRPGEEVGIPLALAITIFVVLTGIVLLIVSLFQGAIGMPALVARFLDNRRREKGYRALSQGLIAASSGDVDSARVLAKESSRLLKDDPLVALLKTQTALLQGRRDEARESFQTMLDNENTRLVALRGLFLEAERQGEMEAARHYAEEAVKDAPALPWAGKAKLRYQAADNDWEAAVKTLEANRAAGLIDRDIAKRHRAVLLTARAMSEEQAHPEKARKLSREAHRLAKGLVPAATSYARSAVRLGDIKSAARTLEACWKQSPHPEIAEAYAYLRTGDSVQDRLKRARKLADLKPNHPEGNFAIAIASIDAGEWEAARSALQPLLTTRPTERACLLMADIEEGQHGDKGRMRDWLSRAVRAPADEVWTADGHVSEEWLPMSPVTGEIDAFEWRVPVKQIGNEATPIFTPEDLESQAAVTATGSGREDLAADEVIEAEVVVETSAVVSEVTGEKTKVNAGTAAPQSEIVDKAEPSEETLEAQSDKKVATAAAPRRRRSKKSSSGPRSANDNTVAKGSSSKEKAEGDGEATATGKKDEFENPVEFPLPQRPDDPGVDPEKVPTNKGFKLF